MYRHGCPRVAIICGAQTKDSKTLKSDGKRSPCARAQVVRVHILTPILSPPIYSPNFLAGKVTHQRASTDLVSGLARAAWLFQGFTRDELHKETKLARKRAAHEWGRFHPLDRLSAVLLCPSRETNLSRQEPRQVISRIALPEP